jgi:hypothetical protein
VLAHEARNLSLAPVDNRRWRWLAALGLSVGLTLTTAPAASWTAAIQPDPVTRQSRCLLTSETQTTSAGHDDSTPVSLVFNGSSLLVVTQSDLDPSFADLQLVVDDKPPIRSDKIIRKTDPGIRPECARTGRSYCVLVVRPPFICDFGRRGRLPRPFRFVSV